MKINFPCFLLILFLGTKTSLSAQNIAFKLTGQLLDSSGKALPNATLRLQNKDRVRNYISNSAGLFNISLPDTGIITLSVSHQNKSIYNQLLHITKDTFLTIYDPSAELEEILITTVKPSRTKREGNKLVFYPSETLKQGKTVADLFSFTPTLRYKETGAKGEASLDILGKDNTVIFINGKPSFMSVSVLLTMLQGAEGELVEKIEIIRNPDASYTLREQGAAVVNIVMKRNDLSGWNGQITLRNRQNSLNSQSAALSLRHTYYNISNHTNVWIQNQRARFTQDFNYDFTDNNYVQNNRTHTPRTFHLSSGLRHTFNYNLSQRQSLQLTGVFSYSLSDYEHINKNIFKGKETAADSNFLVRNQTYIPTYSAALNTYYTFNINAKNSFDFILSYDFFRSENTNSVDIKQGTGDVPAQKKVGIYRQNVPQIIHSLYAAATHKYTLKEGHNLSGGISFYYTNTDNNLRFNRLLSEGIDFNNLTQSNHFIYKEPIYNIFISYDATWNTHFQSIVGFKLDDTRQIGRIIQTGQSFQRHLLFPLPQINLIYSINDEHQLNLVLETEVIKPTYSELNPFRVITGNNTYYSGNPFLRLPYVWSLDINYNFPHFYFLLGYANINPMYREAQIYDPKLNFIGLEPINYGRTNRIYLLGNYNQSLFKNYITINAEGIINYSLYKGRIPFSIIDRKGLGGLINLSVHTLLSKKRKWSAGISYDKVFPSMTFVGFIYEGQNIGINIQKIYKNWVFKLSANDVFRTNTLNDLFFMSHLRSHSRAYWDTQSLTVTLRYQFGNTALKKTAEKKSDSDNQKRIKGNTDH